MTIRVAIVGLGRISTLHVQGYTTLPAKEVTIAAVCDVDHTRAEIVARETGARAATLEEILDDKTIDAVEVLVPSYAQAEIALRVIAAGKHVTVQKPLAGDRETGSRIVEAAESAGVQLRVFENTINSPAWRLAERIVAEGKIGDPLSIYLRWANSLLPSGWEVPPDSSAWRMRGPWAARFTAPTLFDDSAHLFSPAVALFGPVARVIALSGHQEVAGRRTGFPFAIAWHHTGGGQALVEGTLCSDLVVLTTEYSADTSVVITGSKGICWINTGEGRAAARPTVEVASQGILTPYEVDHQWRASWPLAQAEWVAALASGTRYRWTGREALAVLDGALLLDEAVRVARKTAEG